MASVFARAGLCTLALLSLAPFRAIADAAADVETWVRLKGDAAGAVTYEWVTGTAWGIPLDDVSRPLFQIESVTLRQITRFGPAHYVEQSYACRLYRDAATGEYISRFINPFTRLEVKLGTRCSPGPSIRYTPERVSLVASIPFESSALNAPMQLTRIDIGEHVTLRREAHSQYRSESSGELRRETSLDTFVVPARDLANPRLTSLDAAYQWTSVTQWMAELAMGERPGRMLWSINGRKFAKATDLPPAFRAALERAVPGALEHRFTSVACEGCPEALSPCRGSTDDCRGSPRR